MAYSNDINEIIEKKPNWFVRCGIGIILFILTLFLLAAWFIKYPDKIICEVNITTPNPPIEVMAKVNASIMSTFSVVENDTVKRGEHLLLLENSASYAQIQILRTNLNIEIEFDSIKSSPIWLDSLGALQTPYNSFALAYYEYLNYKNLQPYDKRIKSLTKFVQGSGKNLNLAKEYLSLSEEEYALKQNELKRYTKLFNKGVISISELEQRKQVLLQKEMGYSGDLKNLNTEMMSMNNFSNEIMKLELEKIEYEQKLKSDFLRSKNEVLNKLKEWENIYMIDSPIEGRISYFNEVKLGDYLMSGERVLTIIPLEKQNLQAVGKFSVNNAGKVTKNNKVIIKLNAFPYQEYGTLLGRVVRVSEIPLEKMYSVVIELPNGLETNYENKIIFKQRLTATADIVTKDQSLLRRIFYQFKNLSKSD